MMARHNSKKSLMQAEETDLQETDLQETDLQETDLQELETTLNSWKMRGKPRILAERSSTHQKVLCPY
jgi:hypothetical protein